MKLKAKGREKSHLIRVDCCLLVSFVQVTFILTCFAKYDFLVDFFVVTNQANYQDCLGIYV